jgi:ubiquinone biosynthesis protein Coq4
MAGEMGKPDYQELDRAYMEGPSRSLDQFGSVIMTSSKWLNSPRFRDVYAQEGLRKTGRDVPPTYMVHQAAMAIAELQPEEEMRVLFDNEVKVNPVFAAWVERRSLCDFTVPELEGYKSGTLGGAIHDYLAGSGFDLNHSKRGLVPSDGYTYMLKQRVVGHDVEHIVSGFGPNPVGEYALIACNLKCYYDFFTPEFASELTRMSGFLFSTGAMKMSLHYPAVMGEFLIATKWGIEMAEGMKAPLMVTDWRSYLDWPMDAVREDLGIRNSPPPGHWEWTHEARRG